MDYVPVVNHSYGCKPVLCLPVTKAHTTNVSHVSHKTIVCPIYFIRTDNSFCEICDMQHKHGGQQLAIDQTFYMAIYFTKFVKYLFFKCTLFTCCFPKLRVLLHMNPKSNLRQTERKGIQYIKKLKIIFKTILSLKDKVVMQH